jgi:hypothetical protein
MDTIRRLKLSWAPLLLLAINAVPGLALAQHGAGSVEAPLRLESGRLAVVVEAADGSEFDFILSTGTPPTILSASTAAALGTDPALTIGGHPVDFEGSQTIPDDNLTVDGFAFDGMIGPQTLNQFDILIDVPGQRLVLRPIGPPAAWDGVALGDPVPVRVFHGQMIALSVDLNGQTFMASLDTGHSVLIVNEPVTQSLHVEQAFTGQVTLGGTEIADVPVEMINVDVMARWDPDSKGFVLLGAPIAYDCAIAISWVRSEIQVCAR